MIHQFSLKIDPIIGSGHVLLNSQPIFSQSQLQICTTQNFYDWYKDLPDLMFAEVNDNYTLSVECLDIHYDLLSTVFSSSKECQSLKHISIKPTFTVEQRFSWLNEVASKMNVALPEVPRFSVQTTYSAVPSDRSIVDGLPPFYRKYYNENLCQVNVWLVAQNKTSSISKSKLTDNDIILCESPNGGRTQIANVPILCQAKSKWSNTIAVWIDQMIFLPYLLYCQESILKQKKSSSFEVASRLHMITRDEPYVELTLPSRIEAGTTCPIEIKEFPNSNLGLHISDPNLVVQKNNLLLAQKPGHATIAVVSTSGQILQEKDIDVYVVNRVTSIALSSGKGNSILVGDSFTVQSDCRPQGAENLSRAVWSVTPANALKNIGGGQFSALMPGKCTVTLTVEKVSQSISLTVLPLATDIRLPAEIRFKVNAAPHRVSAVLLPNGSACKEIRCTVADGNIAQWNPNTKSVVPISEGNTKLEALAIGPSGNVLFSKSCPITILPEKDIITPPTLLTLAICCAILALLTGRTLFFPIAMLGSAILFVASAIVNGIPWIKHCGTISNKIQASIGTVGAIISIIILFAST